MKTIKAKLKKTQEAIDKIEAEREDCTLKYNTAINGLQDAKRTKNGHQKKLLAAEVKLQKAKETLEIAVEAVVSAEKEIQRVGVEWDRLHAETETEATHKELKEQRRKISEELAALVSCPLSGYI